MAELVEDSDLQRRLSRDQANADRSAREARKELGSLRPPASIVSSLQGVPTDYKERLHDYKMRKSSLEQIQANSFQAMVEIYCYTIGKDGKLVEQKKVWYANENASRTSVLGSGTDEIAILSWTHPGIQVALSTNIDDYGDVRSSDLKLRGVVPRAKALFDSVRPDISGVYDPGGPVRFTQHDKPKTGLKAIKLKMTPDQVKAFKARTSGMMIVTGAPGSGKTTVALQRIRFLIDRHGEREVDGAEYSSDLTKVFLANDNLLRHAKDLLEHQLDLSASVITEVNGFIKRYIDQVWNYKHGARSRTRNMPQLEIAARTSISGLSTHEDLAELWECFEEQISDRLRQASRAAWFAGATEGAGDIKLLVSAIERAANARSGQDPAFSSLSMAKVFDKVREEYNEVRQSRNGAAKQRFDEAFSQWLYWVYDPLSAIESYFGGRETVAGYRIKVGTAGVAREAEVIERARSDWSDRVYGEEDHAWIAWLLRFCLPDEVSPSERFRRMPSALSEAMTDNTRWTHVAIDEAQDLSVAQASFLGSLVDPSGALTVSADFRQVVNPVQGMQNARAFEVGRSIPRLGTDQIYPFAKNMRQSKQIGEFLGGFYDAVFKERRPFAVNDQLDDAKPQVIIAQPQDRARRIRQIVSALGRSHVVESTALLVINDDKRLMERYQDELEAVGVDVTRKPLDKGLLLSSAERVKGLEFDACIVLGLENAGSGPNFALNRAYVVLSRPARRLFMICSEPPSLLKDVDRSLFDLT